MRGKTKGFFEDTGIILVLVATICGAYYFYDDMQNEKNIQVDIQIKNEPIDSTTQEKEKSFIEKNIIKIKNIFEETLSPSKKESVIENTELIEKNKKESKTIETTVVSIIEKKKENTIKEEDSSKIDDAIIKEEIINKIPVIKEIKNNSLKKIEVIKKEKNVDISVLRVFLRQLKFDISNNIEKNKSPNAIKTTQNLKIRITVLKNGDYEELTFISGDKKLFENNKENILKVFPLTISDVIKDEFPRYVRINIK